MRWLVDLEKAAADGTISAAVFSELALGRVLTQLAVRAFDSGFEKDDVDAYQLAKSRQ